MAAKSDGKAKPVRATIREIAVLGLCAAILLAVQVAKAVLLPFLPNIELVSPLIIVFTLAFRRRVLYVIYTFALLEGVIWGFNPLWWVPYLYVWTLLAGAVWLLRSMRRPLGWAVVAGAFGLAFGALTAIPYLFTGGLSLAVSYWVNGIPFDLIHCAGNFVLCLVLWRPLTRLFDKLVPFSCHPERSEGSKDSSLRSE